MTRALAHAPGPHAVAVTGRAQPTGDVLRSPASGTPCVCFRLRVVEHVTARLSLVHEIASDESFEIDWQPAGRAPLRVRIEPAAALVQAAPVLHREGSPGARAVAAHLGLAGAVRVEEVLVHVGEVVEADGVLDEPPAGSPFRADGHTPCLEEAVVRVPTRAVGPTLLPWALGTAAALLGGIGAATYAISHAVTHAHGTAGESTRQAHLRIVPAALHPSAGPAAVQTGRLP